MKLARYFPDSLAARTVLLVVAVIAVAEYATFSIVLHNEQIAHMRQTTQFVAGQIRLLQAILPGLDDETRHRLEDADVGEQWLQLHPDGDSVPKSEPQFRFASHLRQRVGERLGEAIVLRATNTGQRDGLWIGFMADDERWWLVLPPPRFEPKRLPHDLWWWLASVLAALLLIAGLFVRSIVGPLARLGEAVTATGDGSAQTVSPEGPKEVRRLAERHNTMLEQLAEADADRQEMLAGLTHDLRAPLARLRVRLALLGNNDERAGLTRDADDMERIVGQCLSFLRSEKKPAQPPPPILIADAISDEVARHRELGRPLEIYVSDAAASCQVMIAHGNLQRLLDNLIDNALQYGKPPIEVALDIERPGTLTLRVRDHGEGIPGEQRAHALEAFVQIDPARATRGSCGLGLAIVQRIVVACGGNIRLTEAAGRGLEVLIELPTKENAPLP